MKSVLLSIKPKYCELIANGKKTVEVRKTKPNIETPFKCYIYCTKGYPIQLSICNKTGTSWVGNGKVIGEFVCDNLTYIEADYDIDGTKHLFNIAFVFNQMCLRLNELFDYLYKAEDKPNWGWAWHISDLKIYDEPKELREFRKPEMPTGLRYENDVIKRPPQSWCYVEELR